MINMAKSKSKRSKPRMVIPNKCEIRYCQTIQVQRLPLDIGNKKPILLCTFHRDCYENNIPRLKWILSKRSYNPEDGIKRNR